MLRHVDEIAREVESLQGELEEARTRALQHETSLAQLEERRAEVADRLELAQRQIADLALQVERRQAELEEAREEAVYDAFIDALALRDGAALDAAAKLDAAVDALAALKHRREHAADALGAVPPRFEAAAPAQPAEFDEAWARVVALVRADVNDQLEDELVQAAAASPGGRAIQELPTHLREVAVQRRREIQKRARRALRQAEPS